MRRKQVWGVLLIAAAAVVLLSEAGIFPDVSVFSVLFTIGLGYIAITSLMKLDFYLTFFPLAIILMINKEFLGVEAISSWTWMIVAFLLSMGCSILFKSKSKKIKYSKYINIQTGNEKRENTVESGEEDYFFSTQFSDEVRYVSTDDLKSVHCDCSFGELKVYLNQSTIQAASAIVVVDVSFGNVEIFVPKNWRVEDLTSASFGETEIRGYAEQPEKTLQIRGSVSFGGLQITYI